MSRFEPNVEPSMEEILASIRRIIAEDTSGSRTAPPIPSASPSLLTPRAGANVKPAATPQRGFMSREAFLRSPVPAADETANQRYFTPVSPHDPQPGVEPETEKSQSSSVESEKVHAKPAAAVPAVEPVKPSDGASEKAERDGHEAVEAKVTDEAERRLRPSPTPAETKSETAAETVDAQLAELLGEDLKALQEAEKRDLAKPETEKKSEAESVSAKRTDPIQNMAQKPASETVAGTAQTSTPAVEPPVDEEPVKTPASQDTSDPFAFDLGPSPFLPRTAVERPAERPISIDPASGHARSSEPPRADVPAYGDRGFHKVNGSAAAPEPVRPTAPPPKSYEPVAPPSNPSQGPTRPTFAVPSVSATLGPHRRLEPLSESFKPAPADYRGKSESPAPNPFPRRDFGLSSEKPSPSAPRYDRPDAILQPSAPLPPATPSMLDTTASMVGSGDRTMEDAVADLLRPLLKTWLAENMPKIVERALRREMTERLLPGQKNPRD